jgi:hypothetical protein
MNVKEVVLALPPNTNAIKLYWGSAGELLASLSYAQISIQLHNEAALSLVTQNGWKALWFSKLVSMWQKIEKF